MTISLSKYFTGFNLKDKKYRQRSLSVLLYTFNNFSTPIFNFLLSAIIIERISLEFWGEYVSITLIVNLSALILAWGNKEYLMRIFSKQPSQISIQWWTSLIQRFVLCLLLIILFFIFLDLPEYRIFALVFWIFTLFLYKSFEVLFLYKRAFLFSLILESLGYIVLLGVGLFYPSGKFTIDHFILLFAGLSLLKFCAGIIYFRHDIFPDEWIFGNLLKSNSLFLALPFFLPSVIGMLQGKMDLYCAAYFLSSIQVGKYQVYMNLLTIPHSLALFTIMPFIKNVYRLPFASLKKIMNRLTLFGFIVPFPAVAVIYLLIEYYYHFRFSTYMYIVGYLQLVPFFLYFFRMQLLLRYDKQVIIVWITLATACFSFLTSVIFIPFWNIEGAIIANTITQWVTLALFIYTDYYLKTNGAYLNRK